nr:receptor-type tyrosine-protein phosphatase epsilon-like isoform X2 [Biomphalaria glabrata]
MNYFIIFSLFFLYFNLQTKACNVGWFGDSCQYKCHCRDNAQCDATGACNGSEECERGWFGYKCQYRDLAIDGVVSNISTPQTVNILTDGNDTSCLTDRNVVAVQWTTSVYFTWLRIVVRHPSVLTKVNVSFIYNLNQSIPSFCNQPRFFVVNNLTADFRCDLSQTTWKVILEGQGVWSLCSVYINGGRNVALKQNASQTSNYSTLMSPENAVDGNSVDIFLDKPPFSCTHTYVGDKSPRWTLTFGEVYTVYRLILVNRGDNQGRLAGFLLQTFDVMNRIVMNYTDPRKSISDKYYVNTNSPTLPLKRITIQATSSELILTLCEVEAYGDCPSGKWSLACNLSCDQLCPSKCLVHSGQCETNCVGYTNPPNCTFECPKGRWGVNCSSTCSNCFHGDCNTVTGECILGCLGYDNPPYCTNGCSTGLYGKNCTQECFNTCRNESCDSSTGHCQECVVGFHGDFCLDANDPPVCDTICQSGYYGKNCSEVCSSHCVNGTCQATTGHCIVHENKLDSSSQETALIVGIVLALVAVVVVLVFVTIRWRGKVETTLRQILQKLQCGRDTVELSNLDEFDCNENRNTQLETKFENAYHNYENEPEQSTAILVKDFSSYVLSHDSDFFVQEFKRITNPRESPTEAASSLENRKKNLYTNISPYDYNRVMLTVNSSKNEADYINASYISGFDGEDKFIASQGPSKMMINDFIRMLWEEKIEKVVMLTSLVENGKVKCERYLPDEGKIRFGNIKVALIATHKFCDYTISLLELSKKGDESHSFTHFHFTAWPDNSVPLSPWSIVEFKHKVNLTPTTKPVLVHCSAGVGRTGTYIAFHNAMKQAQKTDHIDIFQIVVKLRKERMFMVQNSTQYEFLFKTIQMALLSSKTTLTGHAFVEKYKGLGDKSSSAVHLELEKTFKGLETVSATRKGDKTENNEYAEYQYEDIVCKTIEGKNRFPSILPNPVHQVVLTKEHKDLDDYINAVLIPGYKGKAHHILTQLPMPSTVVDFWRLVIQHRASLIVAFEFTSMLSDKTFGSYLHTDHLFKNLPYEVQSSYRTQTDLWEETGIMVHIKKTAFKSEHHRIVHLKSHFTDLDSNKMFNFMKHVRSHNTFNKTVVFTCRNGAQYSGLACVLYLLVDRFDSDMFVSVPTVVGSVKSIRPEVLSDLSQYVFVHKVLQRYIELSSQYNNVGDDALKQNQARLEASEHKEDQVYANIVM